MNAKQTNGWHSCRIGGGETMKSYLNVKQVMEITGTGQATAYGFIKMINEELKQKGYITVSGKVAKKAFFEHYPVDDDVKEAY